MSKNKVIPDFLPRLLAEAILNKRIKEELTLRFAAGKCEISLSVLYRMEVGEETPSLNNYYRVCKWLDKPLDAFFVKPEKEQL